MLFNRIKNIIRASAGSFFEGRTYSDKEFEDIDAEYERLFGNDNPTQKGQQQSSHQNYQNPYLDPKEVEFYQVLNLPHNSSFEQIRQAYKNLIKIYHPDKWIHKTPQEQKQAAQKAQQINLAYSYFKKKMNA
jgi:DnaJ-domain-containing protein 1